MNIEPDTQREFPRIHFDRQVKLNFIHDKYYPKVNNLSLTGMFIKGGFRKHESKYCLIDLYQTEKSVDLNLSLRVSGKVVRQDDKGIAIEFISMSFASYMFLQSTLVNDSEETLAIRQKLSGSYPFKISDDLSISSETNSFQ